MVAACAEPATSGPGAARIVDVWRRNSYCGWVTVISAFRGDITTLSIDAIVNAANSSLLGGGGVDGAIHRAAGPQLLEECRRVRSSVLPDGLPTGHAVSTKGYALPAKWVIHTVGPIHDHYPDGGVELLRAAHVNSMRCAYEAGARTLAFPAISCGVYGWETRDAAPIAVQAVIDTSLFYPFDSVHFVLSSDDALADFQNAIDTLLPK